MYALPLVIGVTSQHDAGRLFSDVVPWIGLLLGVVLIGAIAIYAIRRTMRNSQESGSDGFTLQDLRELHASGEMTIEEFERAKAAMIGRLKNASMKESTPDDSSSEVSDH